MTNIVSVYSFYLFIVKMRVIFSLLPPTRSIKPIVANSTLSICFRHIISTKVSIFQKPVNKSSLVYTTLFTCVVRNQLVLKHSKDSKVFKHKDKKRLNFFDGVRHRPKHVWSFRQYSMFLGSLHPTACFLRL